ncbi:hypothetical protein [Bacillus thuringiensis]|uniref:Uncharacterized protein n=1 Tax=Bacillus thuringiensis TaxID=1428 RepID=A0AAW9JN24_BACTU|nr:hypothetical protein [Bacillus thuringiensis]MDZ5480095.1 hypothetical protein [Bacillus thuringiensis]
MKMKKTFSGIACLSVLAVSLLSFSPATATYASENNTQNVGANCECSSPITTLDTKLVSNENSSKSTEVRKEINNLAHQEEMSKQFAVTAKLAETSFYQDYKFDGKTKINFESIDLSEYNLQENEITILNSIIKTYNENIDSKGVNIRDLQNAWTGDVNGSGFTVYMTKADLQNIATTFLVGGGCLVGGLLGLPAGSVGAGVGCFIGGMVGSVASTFVNQGIKSGAKMRFNWAGKHQWTKRM